MNALVRTMEVLLYLSSLVGAILGLCLSNIYLLGFGIYLLLEAMYLEKK